MYEHTFVTRQDTRACAWDYGAARGPDHAITQPGTWCERVYKSRILATLLRFSATVSRRSKEERKIIDVKERTLPDSSSFSGRSDLLSIELRGGRVWQTAEDVYFDRALVLFGTGVYQSRNR